jgi:hypothetical protein
MLQEAPMAGYQEEQFLKEVQNPEYAAKQAAVDDSDPYESILKDADTLIHGARPDDYSHPLDDFCDTADYWTNWGHARKLLAEGKAYSPEDVAMMMNLMKISREGRKHMYDNVLDGPGYVGCLGRVIAERLRRGWGSAYEAVRRPWHK